MGIEVAHTEADPPIFTGKWRTMTSFKNRNLKNLGIPEIIAVCLAVFVQASWATPAPGLEEIGTLETLNIVGSGDEAPQNSAARRLVPLQFEGMARPSYFTVDPEMKTLMISREFIAEHNLWEYKFEREINLPQANGSLVAGDLVRFYVLVVGSKTLSDVQAVICDECEETAGQSLLEKIGQ